MIIVDSQVHIWAASTPERPWPAQQTPHRPVPFSGEDLLREMNAAGVHGALIVPPPWEGFRNDLALEAAKLHPDRFAVMGLFDLDAQDPQRQITSWRNQAGMLGMRFTFNRPSTWSPIVEKRIDWLWREAERAAVPIMLIVPQSLLHLIDDIAERYTGLKLIIDHLALSRGKSGEEAFEAFDKLLAIAKRPNVAVKLSGLPGYSVEAYPYRWLHPYVRRVYDTFGPNRMFWGSDLTRLPCSYSQAITMFTEEMPWLSAEDKEWIMGRSVCEWLRWDPIAVDRAELH